MKLISTRRIWDAMSPNRIERVLINATGCTPDIFPPRATNGTIDAAISFSSGELLQLCFQCQQDVLFGDINLDGVVNLLDVGPFIDLLSSGQFQLEADLNRDNEVNLLDIQPFVNAL